MRCRHLCLRAWLLLAGLRPGAADIRTKCSKVIKGNYDMSYFATDLESVNLLYWLDDPAFYFTIFAPSDKSFTIIPTGHKGMLKAGSETLRLVMHHHIHQGTKRLYIDQLNNYNTLSMTSNGTIDIDNSTAYDLKFGPPDRQAQVVVADVPCKTGVIHVVDRIFPDSPRAPLPTLDLADLVLAMENSATAEDPHSKHFTIAGGHPLLQKVLKGKGPETVLMPSDQAFYSLGIKMSTLVNDAPLLKHILKRHVLMGRYVAEDFSKPGFAESYDDGNTVRWDGGYQVEGPAPRGTIVIPEDSDQWASNGVLHVVSNVMLPPGVSLGIDSIPSIIVENDNMRTYSEMLGKTEISSELRRGGAQHKFTIFLPVDGAFSALPTGVMGLLGLRIEVLRQLVQQHIVYGQAKPPEWFLQKCGPSDVRTMLSSRHALCFEGEDMEQWQLRMMSDGSDWDDSELVARLAPRTNHTILASNGIIHPINTVLMPPEINIPTLDLLAMLSSRDDLSKFTEWVKQVYDSHHAPVLETKGPWTVFAFTDAAYEALKSDEKDSLENPTSTSVSTAKLAAYHILDHEYVALQGLHDRAASGVGSPTMDKKEKIYDEMNSADTWELFVRMKIYRYCFDDRIDGYSHTCTSEGKTGDCYDMGVDTGNCYEADALTMATTEDCKPVIKPGDAHGPGRSICFAVDNIQNDPSISSQKTSKITSTNILATNGILHIIDKVMFPPNIDQLVHSGWGWEECVVKDGAINRCHHEYQCYAHHTAEHLFGDTDKNFIAFEVAFAVVCIILGCWLRHHHTGLLASVPYELTIFLFSGAFGGLALLGKPFSHFAGFADVKPHLIFYMFLPPLMFHSSFCSDTYASKRVIPQILLLGTLGLVFAALLTAVLATKLYTSYEWKFFTCFIYGVIISAIDPVATIQNMKGLVSVQMIPTIMLGESLLGSSVSVALVEILMTDVPTGTIDNGGEFVAKLLIKLVGGPVLGYVLGLILCWGMKGVFSDAVVEVTATFVFAYIAFFLGEAILEVSGVLAVVTLGAVLSYKRTCISPEVFNLMSSFWEIVVFITDTLIFGLTGMIVVLSAFKHVKGSDFGYVIIGYFGINVIRLVVMFAMSPFFKKFSEVRIPTAYLFFFAWMGLRGGVALSLALMIKGDDAIHCYDPKVGDRFLLHTAAIVIQSLCINALFAGIVVKKFNLNQITNVQKRNMRMCFTELTNSMDVELMQLKLDPVLSAANWNRVKHVTTGEIEDPYNLVSDKSRVASQQDMFEQARTAYFSLFDAATMRQFRDGLLLGSAERMLMKWKSAAIEKHATSREKMRPLIGSDKINTLWEVPTWKRRLCACRKERVHIRHFGFGFNVLLGFIDAHDYIMDNIDKIVQDNTSNNIIKDHCRVVQQKTSTILNELTGTHGDVSIAMRTKAAARHVLNAGRREIQRQLDTSQIEAHDAEMLKRLVEKQMKKVPKLPRSLPRSENTEVLTEWLDWYSSDPRCKYQLSRIFRYHVFDSEARIFKKENDEERRGFYVVLKGLVRVHYGGSQQICGQGYCCGLLSSLTNRKGYFTDVYAESYLHVARFPAAEVRHCARIYPTMKDAIWLQAGRAAALHCMSVHNPWLSWDRRDLERLVRNSQILEVWRGREMRLASGSFYVLFNGKAHSVSAPSDSVDAVGLIPERLFAGVVFDQSALILSISDPSSSQAKARKRWKKLHERLRVIRCATWLQGFAGYQAELRKIFRPELSKRRASNADDASPKSPLDATGRSRGWSLGGTLRELGASLGPLGGTGHTGGTQLSEPLLSPEAGGFTGGAAPAVSPPERRRDTDGALYTREEFRAFHGADADELWRAAPRPPAAAARRRAASSVAGGNGGGARGGNGVSQSAPGIRSARSAGRGTEI